MAEMKKICAQCGVPMELKKAAYPLGSMHIADRFHVDIYECPKCGRVEFFAAEEDMVTCPVCGSVHSRHEKCAICALNAAYENHVKL